MEQAANGTERRGPGSNRDGRAPLLSTAAVGACAGLTSVAAGELAAALTPGARSPLGGAVRAVIDATPGPMVDVGVALVGERDKPLLALGGATLFGSLGAVEAPVELTLDELVGVGVTEVDALLVCVHNPVGGHRMGNGRWTAVPVAELLARAGLTDELVAAPSDGEVIARAVDGYAVTLPLDLVVERGFVAVGLGGEPLPFGNGFPARLVLPGHYGYAANVKWLAGLEVRRRGEDPDDYWTVRGWPAHGGRVAPSSRIDVPRPASPVRPGEVTVAGYAWAPPEGVEAVDVAVDDGPWRAASLATELSPLSWRAWTYRWDAEPGPHRLRARCRGRTGDQQEAEAAPYPGGARGVHLVAVEVDSRARRVARAVAVARDTLRSRLGLAVASARAWR